MTGTAHRRVRSPPSVFARHHPFGSAMPAPYPTTARHRKGLYGATSTMTGVAAALGALLYGAYGARTLWLTSAGAMVALTALTAALSKRAGVWK